jgi:hypothetical protein
MPTKKGTVRKVVESDHADKLAGLPKAGGTLRLMRKAFRTIGSPPADKEDPRVEIYRQQFVKNPFGFSEKMDKLELELRVQLEQVKAFKRSEGQQPLTGDRGTEKAAGVIDRLLKEWESNDGRPPGL